MNPAITSLLLFPNLEHHRISVGPYLHATAPQPVAVTTLGEQAPWGLEFGYSHFAADELPLFDDETWMPTGTESPMRARLFINEEGAVTVDQLSAGSALFGATVRRPLGDLLGISIFGGQWESTVHIVDGENFQLRALVPSELSLLGFSNTDFDVDNRLKYTISIGSGLGGEAIARVFGPLGVYGRILGKARSFNRHQQDTQNQVRHELHAEGELGLAVLSGGHAFWLSGWGELTSQYETRDAGGKDGIDRQYVAAGIRLNIRIHPEHGLHTDANPTPNQKPTNQM